MPTMTRERILDATAELFRRYGYTGTGLKQIVAEANAPFGSIYHFFPGGKEQLGAEVVRRSGRMYFEIVAMVFDQAADPVSAMRDVFAGAAAVLEETDYIDACPVGTVALEAASSNEGLRQATAEVFQSWIDEGAQRLVAMGVPQAKAGDLITSLIALLEGAFMLSRSTRSTEPMRIAGEAAAALAQAATAPSRGPARTRRLRRASPK